MRARVRPSVFGVQVRECGEKARRPFRVRSSCQGCPPPPLSTTTVCGTVPDMADTQKSDTACGDIWNGADLYSSFVCASGVYVCMCVWAFSARARGRQKTIRNLFVDLYKCAPCRGILRRPRVHAFKLNNEFFAGKVRRRCGRGCLFFVVCLFFHKLYTICSAKSVFQCVQYA